MAEPTNYYKLGLFVIVGLTVALVAAVVFSGARLRKQVVECHTYFNESVQGLEVGARVQFRGVTVGHVGAIEIAPDHRMVDVVSELDPDAVTRMGLTRPKHEHDALVIPPDLRMQLNSQGITGVKFVSIDFFNIQANPAPVLPFPVP
ncbi:MAG: MlaD family protein, partial [Myxococcales bacterium]